MKKGLYLMESVCLTAALVFGTLAGAYIKTADAKTKKSKNVKQVVISNVSKKKLTLTKGKSFKIKARVVAKKGKVNQKVLYKTSNAKVATVSSSGRIKAKKQGTAKITVTAKADSSKKVQIKVTVIKKVLVTKITLDQKQLELNLSDEVTYQLEAGVFPANASNKAIKWSSSDTDVAKVSDKGVVEATGEGKAVITVLAADGSGIYATCIIEVVEEDENGNDDTGMENDEIRDDSSDYDVNDDMDADTGNRNNDSDKDEDGEVEKEDTAGEEEEKEDGKNPAEEDNGDDEEEEVVDDDGEEEVDDDGEAEEDEGDNDEEEETDDDSEE